jgi:putative ABC transport system substrate-binding protein
VPIVFAVGSDPVALGLAESLPRPGPRLTGVVNIGTDLTPKRLEILRELVPTVRRVVTFYNPQNASATASVALAREGALRLGIELIERQVTSPEQIGERVRALGSERADAFFFISDAMVNSAGALIVEQANALGMASMASGLELVGSGALAGYGVSYRDFGRSAAGYVSRILSGTQPGDLPVEAVSVPVFALNLNTARMLGLSLPESLIARAHEVIE